MKKIFLEALNGKILERPPFWFMRQAGRYLPEYREIRHNIPSFLDLCYNPVFASEVTMQPIDRFKPDVAILFSDILVIPDALGRKVSFSKGIGPKLDPIISTKDVENLLVNNINHHLSPVYETVKKVKNRLPEDVSLLGFAGAPWTVATYMVEGGSSRDFLKVKTWAREDAERFDCLLSILVEATTDYLIGQIEAGADAIQIFDTWAGIVPSDQFNKFVITPTKKIISNVRKLKPDIKFIGFPKGIGPEISTYISETGIDCISIDSTLSPNYAAKYLQGDCTIQGNLDPVALLIGGKTMLKAADEIIKNLNDGPFIFNLGHGVMPQTPPENVVLLAEHIKSQGNQ